jgi:hypothetical protein
MRWGVIVKERVPSLDEIFVARVKAQSLVSAEGKRHSPALAIAWILG